MSTLEKRPVRNILGQNVLGRNILGRNVRVRRPFIMWHSLKPLNHTTIHIIQVKCV